MNKMILTTAALVAAGTVSALDLSGTWSLCDGKGGNKVEALVPGDNYTALEAAKILPDPYWRCN